MNQQDIETKVKDLLAKMTLAEKIGQMTQPEKNSSAPATWPRWRWAAS